VFGKCFLQEGVTDCWRFIPDESTAASCGNQIRNKAPTKWDVSIAGMIFKHTLAQINGKFYEKKHGKMLENYGNRK